MSKKKITENNLYYDDQIKTILQSQLTGRANIAPTTIADSSILLNQNITSAIAETIMSGLPSVIPIHTHTGNEEQEHWVGLVIKKSGNKIQVLYGDPTGAVLDTRMNAKLLIQIITDITGSEVEILDLSFQQQINGVDCGVFVADNLIRLATSETSNIPANEIMKILAVSQDNKSIRNEHAKIINGGELDNSNNVEEITDSLSMMSLGSSERLKFVINTIAYVPYKPIDDSYSSSEESDDDTFPKEYFTFNLKTKDSYPFRTTKLKKSTKKKEEIKQKDKGTKASSEASYSEEKEYEELGIIGNKDEKFKTDIKTSKKSKVVEPLLKKLEAEAFVKNDIDKLNSLSVSIGLNRPKSLSTKLNKSLQDELEANVVSNIRYEKIGFFWNYKWYNQNNKEVNYNYVRKFYKQFKKKDKEKAEFFRKENEKITLLKELEGQDKAVKQKGTLIPYQDLREYVKNHGKTKTLVQEFKDKTPTSIIYFSIIDSDTISFNYVYSAYFKIHDSYHFKNKSSPTVMSTGYEFDGTIEKGNYPYKIGSQLDRAIRIVTVKHIPGGVYYSEPNFCILLPRDHLTIPESFINKTIKNPKGSSESVALLRKVIANRYAPTFIFSGENPIITDIPLRAKFTKKGKNKLKFSDQFTNGGLPLKTDATTLKQMSQSHFFEGLWLDNLYINRSIEIQDGELFKFKGLMATLFKEPSNEQVWLELQKYVKLGTIKNIMTARIEINKIISEFPAFAAIPNKNEITTTLNISVNNEEFFEKVKVILQSNGDLIQLIENEVITFEELIMESAQDLKIVLYNPDILAILEDEIEFSDISDLFEYYKNNIHLDDFEDFAEKVHGLYDKGYNKDEIIELYDKERGEMHIECILGDPLDIALEMAPDIDRIVLEYLEEGDLEWIKDELGETEQQLFLQNLGWYDDVDYSGNSNEDYSD